MSMFHELMMRKKEQIMYATIKGTLTESPEGVFSGFTPTNYLSLDCGTNTINQWEISIDFSYTVAPSSYRGLFSRYSPAFQIYMTSTTKMFVEINGSTDLADFGALTLNSDYNIKIKYNAGSWNMILTNKTTGIKITRTMTTSDIWYLSGIFRFGITQSGNYGWDNTINLNTSYLKLGSTKYKLQAVVGYTVVGSPTITDGVVSGFSDSNYLNLNQIYNAKNIMNTEIYIRAKTPSSFSSGFSYIFSNTSGYASVFSLAISSGVAFISFMGSNLVGTTLGFSDIYISGNPQNNTWYRFKIKGNNGLWVFEVYDDNGNLLGRNTKDWTNLTLDQNYRIKLICLAGANSGEIDLNETYIKINNKLWFNGQQA